MEFDLKYEGLPGEIQATLSCDGEVVATGGGFSTEADVKEWGQVHAQAHKDAVDPPPVAEPVTGEETITL